MTPNMYNRAVGTRLQTTHLILEKFDLSNIYNVDVEYILYGLTKGIFFYNTSQQKWLSI